MALIPKFASCDRKFKDLDVQIITTQKKINSKNRSILMLAISTLFFSIFNESNYFFIYFSAVQFMMHRLNEANDGYSCQDILLFKIKTRELRNIILLIKFSFNGILFFLYIKNFRKILISVLNRILKTFGYKKLTKPKPETQSTEISLKPL